MECVGAHTGLRVMYGSTVRHRYALCQVTCLLGQQAEDDWHLMWPTLVEPASTAVVLHQQNEERHYRNYALNHHQVFIEHSLPTA